MANVGSVCWCVVPIHDMSTSGVKRLGCVAYPPYESEFTAHELSLYSGKTVRKD
jgi:hypothetical protein